MYSQYTTASRMAGIVQQCSGNRFTSMWKNAVATLGAALFGFGGHRVDSATGGLPAYRRLADGDGH